jgi:hypothetical protein
MSDFEYDFTKLNDYLLNSLFSDRVKIGEPTYIVSILNDPVAKERIIPSCLNLAVVTSATLQTLDIFHLLYEELHKDNNLLIKTILLKIFNSVCAGSTTNFLNRLKELDRKFGLSKMMMEDNSSISEAEIAKVENLNYPRFIGIRIPYGEYEEQFQKSWIEHGFITASKNGNAELINYLLSSSNSIPTNIIEAGFISSCKAQQFDTALNISSHLGNIEQTNFNKNYLNSIDNYNDDHNESRKNFISTLILKEQLENDLPLTETMAKNKLKV